ncbi:hypothetical protein EMIT0111MI5_30370 [Burkholderia sp. IT-111MI5]
MDRGPDAGVGRTAAQVAVHRGVDVRVGRFRVLFEQCGGRHDLAGLAIAALRNLLLDPRGLDGLRGLALQALDRRDVLAGDTGERQHARADGLAFEMHRARAALRHAAAELRAGQSCVFANRPEDGHRRIGVERNVLAVEDKRGRHFGCLRGENPACARLAGSVREQPVFASTQSCKFIEQSCKSRARRGPFRYAPATWGNQSRIRHGHDRYRGVARIRAARAGVADRPLRAGGRLAFDRCAGPDAASAHASGRSRLRRVACRARDRCAGREARDRGRPGLRIRHAELPDHVDRLADPVARDARVAGCAVPVPVADARSAAHRRARGRDAAARARRGPRRRRHRTRRTDAAAARRRAAAVAIARYAGRHSGRRAADRKGTAVPADDERAGHATAAYGDRGQPDAPDRARDRMDPRSLRGADARRDARAGGQHERVVAAPPFQARDDAEPAAVPEAAAAARGAAAVAAAGRRRRVGGCRGRLRERVAVQPRIQPAVRRAADARRRAPAEEGTARLTRRRRGAPLGRGCGPSLGGHRLFRDDRRLQDVAAEAQRAAFDVARDASAARSVVIFIAFSPDTSLDERPPSAIRVPWRAAR